MGMAVPTEWGLSMAGCEGAILAGVAAALDAVEETPIRYLEIGVAAGRTFAQVCAALAEGGRPWEAIGLDLPEGIEAEQRWVRPASCLDMAAFVRNVEPFLLAGRARLVQAVSWVWLQDPDGLSPLALVLIDGCHEEDCVRRDFLGVEPRVAPGGVVIFHDTAPWSQDDPSQVQPHRGEPLGVRSAIGALGLLHDARPGWRLLAEAPGREEEGGRGCMVFQKDLVVAYP